PSPPSAPPGRPRSSLVPPSRPAKADRHASAATRGTPGPPARASDQASRLLPPSCTPCSRSICPGRSGAGGPDVDLPADAVLVDDGAEDVAPELLLQLGLDRAAFGEAVEHCPQPRVVGADERQFDAGLRAGARVLAVARPQGDVAAGEQSVDHLILLLGTRGRVDIADAGDGDLATEDLLVEGDGLRGVAREEQVGVELD